MIKRRGDRVVGIGKRILEARKQKDWSQYDLEVATKHKVKKPQISNIESGKATNPSALTITRIAGALGKSFEEIWSGDPNQGTCVRIPLLGSVPCGPLDMVFDQTKERIFVAMPLQDIGTHQATDLFALVANGNSLNADGIADGETLIVERNASHQDGKMYVVRIHGEVAIKHIYRSGNVVKLVSGAGLQEVATEDVEVLGKVIRSGTWRAHD